MVLKINHENMKEVVKGYYESKISLLVYGAFGIGKSFLVRDIAREIAKEKGKEFIEWNRIKHEQKDDVFKYPERYFVLMDIRLSEYDSSDIKGLPNFKEGSKDTIEWRIPVWAKFMTLKNSDGICFFDEINLAPPIVLASCYKIIYDRIIDEDVISPDWLMIGAGNRESDNAFIHSIPSPLKDRCGEMELVNSDVEGWTDWATKNDIDSRIIGFVNFKPSNLYKVDYSDGQKHTTTRGWERVSRLIKDKKVIPVFENLVCSAIGEGIGREFIAFCKLQEKFNLEELIKNPKKLKDVEDISIKYLLVSSVAERYKNKKLDFNKVMEISKALDDLKSPEFVALFWRLCSSYTKETGLFKEDFKKSKEDTLINKYAKYIL